VHVLELGLRRVVELPRDVELVLRLEVLEREDDLAVAVLERRVVQEPRW